MAGNITSKLNVFHSFISFVIAICHCRVMIFHRWNWKLFVRCAFVRANCIVAALNTHNVPEREREREQIASNDVKCVYAVGFRVLAFLFFKLVLCVYASTAPFCNNNAHSKLFYCATTVDIDTWSYRWTMMMFKHYDCLLLQLIFEWHVDRLWWMH